MAKPQGPEEFFEVFRTARKPRDTGPPSPDRAPDPQPPPPENAKPQLESEAAEPVPEPAVRKVEPPPQPPQPPRPTRPTIERKFPLSVFADNEPTLTFRRSTIVFLLVLALVLLFIAYAIGKRGRHNTPSSTATTVTRYTDGFEIRVPALPDNLRNKCAVCLKILDNTQFAIPANAKAYRDFLNTAPEAAFVRTGGKSAFIISFGQQLAVCVGPFDSLDGPDLRVMLDKLRDLRYNGVQQFAHAGAEPLPVYAKLFN